MKTFTLLLLMLLSGLLLPAQDQSPIPKISLQITNYFSVYPRENIFLMTDKTLYKPGETIWFRSFASQTDNPLVSAESSKLYVSLFDKTGKNVTKGTFRMSNGSCSGDLQIPDKLAGDSYFLIAYSSEQSSLEQIPIVKLKIDPQYSNQWVVEAISKDSISIFGKKNELFVVLSDNSGTVQKNELLRYEIKNGTETLEKDKVKTDESGKVSIPFTIRLKPMENHLFANYLIQKVSGKHEVFLPTNLDPVVIRFYPEGGNLIAGVPTKIGYTAFNKWGIPVSVEELF